ncbi:hypothetical protein NC651_031800 [Populus alba x Populus x berolinensis]|nr:hypothetical protein NC651_031800 [Populus alba x Populus x berolinensis]
MIRNLEKRSGADNGSPSRNSGGSDKELTEKPAIVVRRHNGKLKIEDVRLFIDEGVVSGRLFLPTGDKQHLYFIS